MSTFTNIKNEATAVTAIELASGVALSLSGYDTLNNTFMVYSGQENGTLTISGNGYCNSTVYTKEVTAGTVYGITDLDGSMYERLNSQIRVCGPSGTLYCVSLSK
jgi:hypothetical protein